MPLGVLGDVKQKAQHGGGQSGAADQSRNMELGCLRRGKDLKRALDARRDTAKQLRVTARCSLQLLGVPGERTDDALLLERASLSIVELPPAGVRQEAVDAAFDVAEMKSDRRSTPRLRPELHRTQRRRRGEDIGARLHERVRRREQ